MDFELGLCVVNLYTFVSMRMLFSISNCSLLSKWENNIMLLLSIGLESYANAQLYTCKIKLMSLSGANVLKNYSMTQYIVLDGAKSREGNLMVEHL